MTTGYPYLDKLRASQRVNRPHPNVGIRPQGVSVRTAVPQTKSICDIICKAWQSRNKNILVPQVAKNDLRVIMTEIDKRAATMSGNQVGAYEKIRTECSQCGLPDVVDMQGNLAVSFKSGRNQTLQGPVIGGKPTTLSTYKNFGGEITTGVMSVGQYLFGLVAIGALFFVVGYSFELGKDKA